MRRCVLRETGREYAVKIIDRAQDEAIKESIDAEVRILSTLPRHPNISKCRLEVRLPRVVVCRPYVNH